MSFDLDVSGSVSISGAANLTSKGGSASSPLGRWQGYHASRYYIAIDKVIGAVFTEMSGLSIQTDVQETVTEGGNPWKHKLSGYTSFSNVTFKRGLCASQAFWTWYVKTTNGQPEKRNISIIAYSSDKTDMPSRRWELVEAYPVKWSISALNSKTNELMTESIEIAYSYFTSLSL